MSDHSICIANKKVEICDDFDDEMLSANKDFFEEILHKYKEPTKEMIQDIAERICPEKSVFDDPNSRFSLLALYEFQQSSFLHVFMKVFEDKYDLITFCELWNEYAKKIALDDDRYCFILLNVNKIEDGKMICY